MKNIAIRSFVLALVVVGFSASSVSSRASQTNEAKVIVPSTGVVATPTPLCAPSSGNYCGMH